jgi:hypothetical protein
MAALDATGLLQLWHAPSWQEIAATEAKDPPPSSQTALNPQSSTPSAPPILAH